MEIPAMRQPHTHMGQEKYQMLDLNRRLESYLGRVRQLEEENTLLQEEIQALRRSREPQGQRRALEEALREARGEMEAAWRERDRVELEVGSLSEELQALGLRREKEASDQGEARRRLAESRRELEEEQRAQIWLREKATQLEREVLFQTQVHQEDFSVLQAQLAQATPAPMPPTRTHTLSMQHLGQEYSHRTSQAWQEAADVYQKQVGCLEESLTQARARMAQIVQEKRDGQLRAQSLAKELESARARRQLLESCVAQQKDRQNQEVQQLQAHVDALEVEKVELGEQINDLLGERHGLLQLKMSLGLEVATYRALLDSESPSTNKPTSQSVSFLDERSSAHVVKQSFQTPSASCHIKSPMSTIQRSSAHSRASVTPVVPLWMPQRNTAKETPKSARLTEDEQVGVCVESTRPTDWSTPNPGGLWVGKGSIDHFRPEDVHEEVSYAAALSAPSTHVTVASSITHQLQSTNNKSITTDMDEDNTESGKKEVVTTVPDKEETIVDGDSVMGKLVESCMGVPAAFSTPSEGQNSPPKTLEMVYLPSLRTEVKPELSKDSEDEEFVVSSDIDKPKHLETPQFAWAEKELGTEWENSKWEEEDEASESEPESESKSGINNKDNGLEYGSVKSEYNKLNVNTNTLALPSSDQASAESFSHVEKRSEDIVHTVEKEEVNDFFDGVREPLESEVKSKRDALSDWEWIGFHGKEDRNEEIGEQTHGSDLEVQEEEDETKTEIEQRMMDERKDEMVTGSEIEQRVMEEKTAVMEQNLTDTGREIRKEATFVKEHNLDMNSVDTEQRAEQQDQAPSNEKHPDLSEEEKEEEEGKEEEGGKEEEEEDESPNASWRTDPGEFDSYALENTLADTRPLIRYKSDETDVNTQASHLGVSDSSDSEDDREAGAGLWGESKSKRFDTMEDLSEEPEVEAVDEVGTAELSPREERDADPETEYVILQSEQDNTGYQNLTVEGMGQLDGESAERGSEIDFKEHDGDVEEEDRGLEDNDDEEEDTDFMVHEQRASSQFLNMYENITKEATDSEAVLTFQTEHHNDENEIEQVGSAIANMEAFSQSQPENEEEEKMHTDHRSSFPSMTFAAPHEHFFEETCEISPANTIASEDRSRDTAITKARAADGKEEEDEQNLSMLTNVDFTDNLSLYSELNSRPESQANTANSDLEDSHTSEDESPNTSRCTPPVTHAEMMPTDQDHMVSVAATGNVFSSPTEAFGGLFENAFQDTDYTAEHKPLQTTEWEKLNSPSKNPGTDGQCEANVYNIMDEHADQNNGECAKNTSNKVDVFEGKEMEESSQTNGKGELHSFGMKEDLWSSTPDTAATYDKEQSEQYAHENISSYQSQVLGEAWEDLKNLPGTNGNSERAMEIPKAPRLEEEQQRPPQAKQLLCRGGAGEVEAVQSDDSLGEGDSWSSGEE